MPSTLDAGKLDVLFANHHSYKCSYDTFLANVHKQKSSMEPLEKFYLPDKKDSQCLKENNSYMKGREMGR